MLRGFVSMHFASMASSAVVAFVFYFASQHSHNGIDAAGPAEGPVGGSHTLRARRLHKGLEDVGPAAATAIDTWPFSACGNP